MNDKELIWSSLLLMKMPSLPPGTPVKRAERKQKERNKKKSKTDKESTEDVDLSEQEHTTKRVVPSSRNHLDDSRSRSQAFKRCYYLFSSLTHEA